MLSPIIGITCKKTGDIANYINAIETYGGHPSVFASLEKPISEHRASICDYLTAIDGLLLPGGGDINPALFFEERDPAVESVSRSRDALEIWLCQEALEANIPVFGICRGIQVMSVATRGSLHQDIPTQFPNHLTHKITENTDDSWHDIKIQANSRLNEIIDTCETQVNSRHHQSVKDLSEEFVVTAQSADGVIEAIEDPLKRFVIGVQYHPERMFKEPGSLELQEHSAKLFTAFIDACS